MDKNSKEFLALQKKWYSKLKKDGFEDIEQDEQKLKVWSLRVFKVNYNETLFKAKEDYYRLARQFLNDYPFEDKKEYMVWELHSEGVGAEQIAKTLKKKRVKTYRSQVQKIIARLTQQMVTKNVNR